MSSKLFSTEVIQWAIQRTGLTTEELAKKLRIKESSVRALKKGEKAPSIAQAKRLAKAARLPFPMLLLDTVPVFSYGLLDFWVSEEERTTFGGDHLFD